MSLNWPEPTDLPGAPDAPSSRPSAPPWKRARRALARRREIDALLFPGVRDDEGAPSTSRSPYGSRAG